MKSASPNSEQVQLQGRQGLLAEVSWAMYEWARNPYVMLITIYVFAPYFASRVAETPAQGQALIGYANSFAGLIIALSAPVLGAIADRGGARKIPLFFVSIALAAMTSLLWYAEPGGVGLSVIQVTGILMVTIILFEYAAVLHNSLLVAVTSRERIGFASGLGLALGNLASLILLVGVLLFLVLPGTDAKAIFGAFLPESPLFGIDRSQGEASRAMGPLVAIWLIIFMFPLLFFVQESAQRRPFKQSAGEGMQQLWLTVRKLSVYKNIGTFLLARMLFSDGKTAILIFGGVFASAIFGWGTFELVLYGIWLSIFAVIGGILATYLERWFVGPKKALLLDIVMSLIALLLLLSLSPTQVFYFFAYPEGQVYLNIPVFNTLPEVLFLSIATLLAMFVTAAYANARSMMAQLVPTSMETEFFGLYALSGTATAFLGPLLVALFTDWSGSIRIGFSSAIILLVGGLIVMFYVRQEQAVDTGIEPMSNESALHLISWVLMGLIGLFLVMLGSNILWLSFAAIGQGIDSVYLAVGILALGCGLVSLYDSHRSRKHSMTFPKWRNGYVYCSMLAALMASFCALSADIISMSILMLSVLILLTSVMLKVFVGSARRTAYS